MADEETTENNEEAPEMTVREKIREANRLLTETKTRSEFAAPRRNFVFEPKIPGVPRTKRPPAPGYNSDPIYTEASKKYFEFQQGALADYQVALADYQKDLETHNSNVKLGIPSEAPVAPEKPEMPADARAIREADEVTRWFKALGRAQAIRTTRTGIAKQLEKSGAAKTDSTRVLTSDELKKRQEEAMERRKKQTGIL